MWWRFCCFWARPRGASGRFWTRRPGVNFRRQSIEFWQLELQLKIHDCARTVYVYDCARTVYVYDCARTMMHDCARTVYVYDCARTAMMHDCARTVYVLYDH